MKISLPWTLPSVALAMWLAVGSAQARETFALAQSPAGQPFWHLLREDAPRAIVTGAFFDVFAMAHPESIAAPVVGAAMIQLGPSGMSAGEYNEQLRDAQADCRMSSQPMSATFSVEARAEDFSEALDLCTRSMMEPALREKDFERLRRASVVGRARMGNNPNALAGYLMRRLTWGHAPFSRWSEPEEIAKIGAGEVDLWRREVLARDNLTIIAVGPLDAASFGVLIDRSFGHLPEKAATTTGLAPAPLYPAKTIVFERPGDQTVLLMEGALTIEPAESQAAAIGNNVLGGGSDGRLGRAVRGEQGATYGISSGMGVLAPGRRTFSIRSALASDLAAAALRRVRDETDRWRHEGVSEAEAAWSRSRLAANADRGVETPGGKVAALLSMLRNGRTAEDEAGYVEALRATSTAEINRVLRERVPAPMTTLIVTPKADGLGADCVIRDVGDIETCR